MISRRQVRVGRRPTPVLVCRSAILITLALPGLESCDRFTTEPASGNILVSIVTIGEPEADRYELRAASETRFVAPSSFLSIAGVPPGEHAVELRGVPANCSVDGANPQPVVVRSAEETRVRLSVTCEDTGVEITTTTTGPDGALLDYEVTIADRSAYVPANGSTKLTKVAVGVQMVTLTNLPDNCTHVTDRAVPIEIVNRVVKPVEFEISCALTTDRIVFTLDTVENRQLSRFLALTAPNPNGIPTRVASRGWNAAWLPGSNRLAYSTTSCDWYYGYCDGGVVILDLRTGETNTPTPLELGAEPAFSADGRYLAFVTNDVRFMALKFLDLAANRVFLIETPGIDVTGGPTWSPDGRTLAFPCVTMAICVVNRDGTGLRRLTGNVGAASPEWSPDGKLIALEVRPSSGPVEIAVIAPDSSGLTRLAPGFDPSWSPDASKLVFARDDGLFTMRADGTNITRITTGRHHDPRWRR